MTAPRACEEHRGELETLAQALLEYETLSATRFASYRRRIDRSRVEQRPVDPLRVLVDPQVEAAKAVSAAPRRPALIAAVWRSFPAVLIGRGGIFMRLNDRRGRRALLPAIDRPVVSAEAFFQKARRSSARA